MRLKMNVREKELFSFLMSAIQNDDVSLMEKAIQQGANIHWQDDDDGDPNSDVLPGATPLHYAAALGKIIAVRFLLEKGVDVNAYCDSLWTPLHYAVDGQHVAVVELLIEFNVDVTKKGCCHSDENPSSLDMSPIHIACRVGNIEILAVLVEKLEKKETLNELYNIWGYLPLHNACQENNGALVQFLLDSGADPELPTRPKEYDAVGATCIEIARSHRQENIILLLQQHHMQHEEKYKVYRY
jgi:ankyrin repeat protein